MSNIHEQLKNRRKSLGLKQEDMQMRVGMPRQKYQRLESNGNPRLDNLELVAKGLKMELMLIPQEKLQVIIAILYSKALPEHMTDVNHSPKNEVADDPWHDLLGNDE